MSLFKSFLGIWMAKLQVVLKKPEKNMLGTFQWMYIVLYLCGDSTHYHHTVRMNQITASVLTWPKMYVFQQIQQVATRRDL